MQVNPFMETTAGEICCVDAKIGFDDNADYRQKEIHALRDTSQEVGGCEVSLRVWVPVRGWCCRTPRGALLICGGAGSDGRGGR